jgi:hypothetical protein
MLPPQGRVAHAFDSFVGMDEPSPEAGSGYPKGRFNIGGVERFAGLMRAEGLMPDAYRCGRGYIPDCFLSVPPKLAMRSLSSMSITINRRDESCLGVSTYQ